MPPSLDEVALIGLADEVDVPWLDDPLCETEAPVLRSAKGGSVPCLLLHRVLVALREERIRHCVLRDPDELVPTSGCARIEVLVHPADVRRLAGVLDLLGFVPLPSRRRSRRFLAYESEGDVWWKLIVSSSASFDRAGSVLAGLARTCLARRQDRPPFFLPSPEDELIAVLLRLALGHEELSPARCRQLQQLALRVRDPAHLEATLDMLWLPRTDVRSFLCRIRQGDWAALLEQRREVARRLGRRVPLAARLRALAGRPLHPLTRRLRKTLPGALTVAVSCSAGPPGIGHELSCRLYGRARRIEAGPSPEPTARGSALPVRLARGWGRGLLARWHHRCGRFVILDRYCDSTRLQGGTSSRLRHLLHLLETRAWPRPDLVLTLASPEEIARETGRGPVPDVPVKGAASWHARRQRPPERVWLDATQDPQVVLREALTCIWRVLQRHRRGELLR